ncbi:hypothetical protein D9M72_401750 [compost metagenome]
MSGPSLDRTDDAQQLYPLYTYAGFHGSGVGTALLAAVIDDNAPAALWVAHPNPRAQAFYRKNGFVTDEAVKTEDEVCEVRVVRQPKQPTRQTSRPEHCVSKPLGYEASRPEENSAS